MSDGISSLIAAQQASTSSQIQTSVFAKQLQAQKQVGEAMVDLLQSVVALAKEAGKGEGLDATA